MNKSLYISNSVLDAILYKVFIIVNTILHSIEKIIDLLLEKIKHNINQTLPKVTVQLYARYINKYIKNYALMIHKAQLCFCFNTVRCLKSVGCILGKEGARNQTNQSLQTANIITCTDYYPFGMAMGGRNGSVESYRYGFNGMEKDDEVKGVGNSYTTEFRQYDSRVCRWLSLDPLFRNFPWQSPYVAFDNKPIYYIDQTGKSGIVYKTNEKNKEGKPILKVVSNIYIYGEGANEDVAEAMQIEVNTQYNNGGDFFMATVDGVEYEVHFEITVNIIDEKEVEEKLLPGGYYTLNAENNFYEIVNTPKNGELGVTLVGDPSQPGSEGGSSGFIKTSEVASPTVSHELNHGFGGGNKDTENIVPSLENDIAVQSKNSSNPDCRKVTQENIDSIFKKVSFNGKNKANVGNPRPALYDNSTGKSKPVIPK